MAAAAPAGHDDQRHEPSTSNRKRRPTKGDDNRDDDKPQPKRGAYQCRFCELWFASARALGGHMGGHRKERQNESLVQAQQLLQERSNRLRELNESLVQDWNARLGALPATDIAMGLQYPVYLIHNQGVTINGTINQKQNLPQGNYFHGHNKLFQ